jgi:peptidoglycan/xylan/chitin deacetylase (PgdA/CDA1 family)
MRRNGTLILCYHRVAEGVEDPFRLCVRPGNFAAHLEEMSRSREPSTLSDVSVPSRRPRVVVTLDDGYRDNLANALPIAESKGVPITVFVTSGILGDPQGFWWDRLGTLLRARPPHVREIDLPVGGRNVRLPLGSSGIRADLDSVRHHLLPLRVTEIERVLDAVSAQWQVGSAPHLTPQRSPPGTSASWRPATLRRSAPTRPITSGFRIVRRRSSRTPSPAPRGSWSGRSAGRCCTSRTHLAAWTTSTIARSTPCDRLGSIPRAPPSPERPVPRPIPTASRGAWSWTGGGLGSKLRCNDGNSAERRGLSRGLEGGVVTMRRNRTLILCYHRVAEGVEDPFHLCVSSNNFAAHLEEMSRSREPSTLADVSVPSRPPRVVVTFDDGFRDNLTNALPIAESKGVPITFFVTSGILGNQNGFWWDRLGTLLRARPPHVREIDLQVGGRNVRLPLGSSGIRADLDSVRHHLLPLRVTDIEQALDAVAKQWQVGSAPPPDAGTLTPEDLRQLAARDSATIGAHTVDHVRLRDRPAREQQDTISASKRDLEQSLGRPVSQFAYPFGRRDDFDDSSVDAVRSAGFDTACTTIPGTARTSTDRHHLPRRLVMDWGRLRFRAQMQRWKLG